MLKNFAAVGVLCLCPIMATFSSQAAAPESEKLNAINQPIYVVPGAGWQSDCVGRRGGLVIMKSSAKMERSEDNGFRNDINMEVNAGALKIYFDVSLIINSNGSISNSKIRPRILGASSAEAAQLESYAAQIFEYAFGMLYNLKLYNVPIIQGTKLAEDELFLNALNGFLKAVNSNASISSFSNKNIATGVVSINGEDFIVFDGPIKTTSYMGDTWTTSTQTMKSLLHIKSGLWWNKVQEDIVEGPGNRQVTTTETECKFISPVVFPGIQPGEPSQKGGVAEGLKAQPVREKVSARPIAVQWDGYDEFIVGTVTLYENATGGKMAMSLPRDEGTCQGNFTYDKKGGGSWAASCTNGLAATGTFEGFGKNKGSAGKGTDTKGRAVKYTIGAEPK